MEKITLSESELINAIQKVIKEDALGGMASDSYIRSREYSKTPQSEKSTVRKAAEEIFRLFDHQIGTWTISPDHRVTQETQKYLKDWYPRITSILELIIKNVVSKSKEENIDDEIMGEGVGGGDIPVLPKKIKLTEVQLSRIVDKVLKEQEEGKTR